MSDNVTTRISHWETGTVYELIQRGSKFGVFRLHKVRDKLRSLWKTVLVSSTVRNASVSKVLVGYLGERFNPGAEASMSSGGAKSQRHPPSLTGPY